MGNIIRFFPRTLFQKIMDEIDSNTPYGINPDNILDFRDRGEELENVYGYTIPRYDVIDSIIDYVNGDKCLIVKSGKGLWAHLLKLKDVEIYSTDEKDPGTFTQNEILEIEDAVKKYSDANVLFCLGYDENIFRLFRGNKIIFINIGVMLGLNGYNYFDKGWKENKKFMLQDWYGFCIHVISFYENIDIEKKFSYESLMEEISLELESAERRVFVNKYSWAIPDEKAINEIVQYVNGEKCLEVGAGNGLWAYLLRSKGLNIITTDIKNPGIFVENEILDADSAMKKYSTVDILFSCWGAYDIDFFTGNKIIFIGEEDGCTTFAPPIDKWSLVKRVDIAQWPGMNDYLGFYEKIK
ncbi:MAG: hypothetical protein Satyrvirus23_2 [Satyrvirus sp.]|uniref:Methyltransferase domain-containing protein n=1 Tax=Satyrvirus sp. TaxID=2487771 RepID=A0A3G5AJC5_9VIRU|nr:MAG: hypothetical protein Satyrvirus23_2 [Satyrvirus sp.]